MKESSTAQQMQGHSRGGHGTESNNAEISNNRNHQYAGVYPQHSSNLLHQQQNSQSFN